MLHAKNHKGGGKLNVRMTTLSENTAGMVGVLGELGWSVLIETDEMNILFDTGASISACHNADVLGIDLSQVDKIVLSHGHFDHTGGLRQVLRKMRKKKVEIIAHPHVWATRYTHTKEKDEFVGIPFQRPELENSGAIFNLTKKPVIITDNIMTTGEIPMVTDFEEIELPRGGGSRFIQEDAGPEPDEILDDQALIIKTELGLVIVLGCAHRGIINTLYHAQQLTGVKQIHTIIGGAHLLTASEERIRLTVAVLKELDVEKLGVCHCTGLSAMAAMAHEFGDKFFFNNTGTCLSLP